MSLDAECTAARAAELGFGPEQTAACVAALGLDLERISSRAAGLGFRLTLHRHIDSTNRAIKRDHAAGEPAGVVHVALEQDDGYGRQGRVWKSPFGGLYCSVLLDVEAVPVNQIPPLSLVASLALHRALEPYVSNARIKWPNDIVLTDPVSNAVIGKLCGISMELLGSCVCAGIGVNLFEPSTPLVVEGKNTPASVFDGAFDGAAMEAVLLSVLSELQQAVAQWRAEGFAGMVDAYRSRMALVGERVTIADVEGAVMIVGSVQGVDEHGRLVLTADDGSTHEVFSGEVHLL